MTTLIKSARVYKAEIPTDPTTLHNHLSENSFTECMDLQARSVGFVPPDEGCSLVSPFPGGLAFRVRIDEKIIPGAVVNAEVEKRAKLIRETTGRKPGKKERAAIKEEVLTDLCKRALVRTTASVTCYYHADSGYLIIPTTSQKVTDLCTSLLVQAVGSVKTETLHVSEVKHGLTTRLSKWLEQDDDPFGRFDPTDLVVLESEKRRVSAKMTYLRTANEGIREALRAGFRVESIGLTDMETDVSFCLTHDFKLRGIDHPPASPDGEKPMFEAQAAIEVSHVVGIVAELVKMLEYKEPEAMAA